MPANVVVSESQESQIPDSHCDDAISSASQPAFKPDIVVGTRASDSGTCIIKAGWFKTYPWLVYDKDKHMFSCKPCVDTNKNNVFTKGKAATVPKKDDLSKHQKSCSHVEVVAAV